jgi:hypothetical protein
MERATMIWPDTLKPTRSCVRHALGTIAFLASLLLFLLTPCYGETLQYDGPYLGTVTHRFEKPSCEVASAVQNADLVFIGTTRKLDTSNYDGITGQGSYIGDIVPDQMMKGSFSQPFLTLTWHPSATSLEAGSRHIFFVKRRQDTLEVLKEIYIHKPGFPCCRTYGLMDGGTTVTLDTIKFFVSPRKGLPKGYAGRLLHELEEESVHRQATAVLLAYEASRKECLPALLYAVAHRKENYLVAVFTACQLNGEAGSKTAMGLLDVPSSRSPMSKMAVFDAIATAGNPASVGPLKQLGDARPEYRVSCAFTIRQISAGQAAPIIKAWLADHKQDGVTETLPNRWLRRSASVESLLNLALQGKNPPEDDLFK